MKKTYRNIMMTMLAVVAVAFASCDTIDENERYIEAELPTEGRKVLVEEFTGQFCIQCPGGHEMIKNIKKAYGDNVIAVGIHAGKLAYEDAEYGLKTAEGDTYAGAWGVKAYPSIVVNRTGSAISNVAQWQDAVLQQLDKYAEVDLNVETEFDEEGAVTISTSILSGSDSKLSYQLWAVESGVMALQLTDADYDAEYVHDHVYRASVNGVGGEPVTLASGIYTNLTHKLTISPKWNADNMSIVAFLYDGRGVKQVVEVPVK